MLNFLYFLLGVVCTVVFVSYSIEQDIRKYGYYTIDLNNNITVVCKEK